MTEMSNSKLHQMVSATSGGDRVIPDSPLKNFGAYVRTHLKKFGSVHQNTVQHTLTPYAFEQLLTNLAYQHTVAIRAETRNGVPSMKFHALSFDQRPRPPGFRWQLSHTDLG